MPYTEDHDNQPMPPLPAWQRGEPHYRCTWCANYRCDGPLKLCRECEAELARRRVGMPSEGRQCDWAGRA